MYPGEGGGGVTRKNLNIQQNKNKKTFVEENTEKKKKERDFMEADK